MDGDRVLNYGEFVHGFEQFHNALRDSSVTDFRDWLFCTDFRD